MNRNVIIGIISAIILVLAIVLAVFFMKGKQPVTPDNSNTTDDIVNNVHESLPELSKEEIKETLQTEVSDEQKEAYNEAITKIAIPERDKSSEITVDEEGTAHYTDVNGNDVSIEMDQSIKDKTDEELDAEYDELMEKLDQVKKDAMEQNAVIKNEEDTSETLDPVTAEKENQENQENQENITGSDFDIKEEIKKNGEADSASQPSSGSGSGYIPPEQRGNTKDKEFIENAEKGLSGDLSGGQLVPWD